MDNDDFVEGIYPTDDLHDLLQAMNSVYGRGKVVSITWDQNTADHSLRGGMAVCQLQYGQCARKFRVLIGNGGFTLFYAGKQKTMESDYFTEF